MFLRHKTAVVIRARSSGGLGFSIPAWQEISQVEEMHIVRIADMRHIGELGKATGELRISATTVLRMTGL